MNNQERFAELGKARLNALAKLTTPQDMETYWPEPSGAVTPVWGDCWKACVEYAVPNLHAEVGFYIEVFNFTVNAAWENHVMLISSDREVSFTLFEEKEAKPSTVLNMQFMVSNIQEIETAMRNAEIPFLQDLDYPWGKDAKMQTMIVETPCGISLTLWGME